MKNKILMALLSVVLAFCLWVYVISVVNPEFEDTYHNIPVVLEGEGILEERGLMVTDNENPTVSLKLKGNRTYLVELNSENTYVIADISKISKAGRITVGYEEVFPGHIPDNAIEVQTRNPSVITLVVEERITKPVNVVVQYTGNVPDGYICDKENKELDFAAVNVTGPKSVVDQITQAVIEVDLNNKTETISDYFVYSLCNEAGDPVDAQMVQTNLDEIKLTLKIQRYKDITLKVDVIDGGGATEKTSSIKITPEVIRISGNETLLERIEDTMVIGSVDLSKLLEDSTLTFPIVLPENVTNETGLAEATVDVKFPNLRIKKLNVTNITAINVPEGLEVDMITQMLEIKVRGPIALVETMKETDITVTVDFANAALGTATMRADVTINSSSFTGVGIISSYQVSATLREPLEEGVGRSGTTG